MNGYYIQYPELAVICNTVREYHARAHDKIPARTHISETIFFRAWFMLYSRIIKTGRNFTSKLFAVRSDSNKYFEPFPLSKAATCETKKSCTSVNWFRLIKIYELHSVWSVSKCTLNSGLLKFTTKKLKKRTLKNQQRICNKEVHWAHKLALVHVILDPFDGYEDSTSISQTTLIITYDRMQSAPHFMGAQKSSLVF